MFLNYGAISRLLAYGGDVAALARHQMQENEFPFPLIDELSIGEIKMVTFEIGAKVYVETLTKYYVGRVVECTPMQLNLAEASWIEETGRMGQFMRTGRADGMAVEAIGDYQIPAHMITGAAPWPHKLFKEDI